MAEAQGRLLGSPRSIALPSFFAFPDPSLRVTSVTLSMSFLAKVTSADHIVRAGIERGANAGVTGNCAYCQKQVLQLRSASKASSFRQPGFLLRSHRYPMFGEKSGL